MSADVRLVAFDLDDTLTPSKSPVAPAMARALAELLALRPVCIITGGPLEQITAQVTDRLEVDDAVRARLHLMPTCGTRYYRPEPGGLREVYAHDLPAEQRAHVRRVLEQEATRLGIVPERTWGEVVEDRGSQVTYSALGQQAPLEHKMSWDPHGTKKEALRAAAAAALPHLEVRSGGSTSVDVTRRGIDKAFGMRELARHTGLALEQMVFIGDRLDEGGNDYPVKALGVGCTAVSGWPQTLEVVRELIARLGTGPELRRPDLSATHPSESGPSHSDPSAAAPALVRER